MKEKQAIFKPIFGDSWLTLPPVMKLHYANRPDSTEEYLAVGELEVKAAPALRLIAPVLRLLGGPPVVNARNVPVTVCFKSEPHKDTLHFVRTFHFSGKPPYVFHSRMVPSGGNRVAEVMKFGLVWRMKYKWQEGRVILEHDGYALNFFGKRLRVPLTWILGSVHAEEHPIDDTHFSMKVGITHPLWGFVYGYRGWFKMEQPDG